MPADDFFEMSDRELSDVVTYLRSFPPVDREVPRRRTGPLAWVLHTVGEIVLAADKHPGHDRPHAVEPPTAEVSVAFGEHVSHICTGCHGPDHAGGPIAGGDPSWAPAMNLTPDASGLGGWTFDQFDRTLRTGIRPDGTAVKDPMARMIPHLHHLDDTEMRALWTYLQQLPKVANGF
jgi:mono/diheme cytochrome c family protein